MILQKNIYRKKIRSSARIVDSPDSPADPLKEKIYLYNKMNTDNAAIRIQRWWKKYKILLEKKREWFPSIYYSEPYIKWIRRPPVNNTTRVPKPWNGAAPPLKPRHGADHAASELRYDPVSSGRAAAWNEVPVLEKASNLVNRLKDILLS